MKQSEELLSSYDLFSDQLCDASRLSRGYLLELSLADRQQGGANARLAKEKLGVASALKEASLRVFGAFSGQSRAQILARSSSRESIRESEPVSDPKSPDAKLRDEEPDGLTGSGIATRDATRDTTQNVNVLARAASAKDNADSFVSGCTVPLDRVVSAPLSQAASTASHDTVSTAPRHADSAAPCVTDSAPRRGTAEPRTEIAAPRVTDSAAPRIDSVTPRANLAAPRNSVSGLLNDTVSNASSDAELATPISGADMLFPAPSRDSSQNSSSVSASGKESVLESNQGDEIQMDSEGFKKPPPPPKRLSSKSAGSISILSGAGDDFLTNEISAGNDSSLPSSSPFFVHRRELEGENARDGTKDAHVVAATREQGEGEEEEENNGHDDDEAMDLSFYGN